MNRSDTLLSSLPSTILLSVLTTRLRAAIRRLKLPTRCSLLLALCLVTLSASSVLSGEAADNKAGLVRAGCEYDYPPFCIVTDDGRADGFSVELMQAALNVVGRKAQFTVGSWPRIRQALEKDTIDALPLVGRTPEREAVFDFTVPYMTVHGTIVVREGTDNIQGLPDLRGKRIAVLKGDNAEEFVRRHDLGAILTTTETFTDALRQLSEGKQDAVVIQKLVATRLIEENDFSNLRFVGKPLTDFAQSICFAVHEDNKALLADLNEGLSMVIANGTFQRLHRKWFSAIQSPSQSRIVVGGDHDYPPYEYLDENGQPAGYNVELTMAIARKLGVDVHIRLGPWADIRKELETGEIDLIHGMFYSPERDKAFDFSPPHTVIHHVAVIRRNGAPPETAKDLKGKRIVVMQGDIMHDFAIERGLDDHLTVVENQEEALRQIADGQHDCALVARLPALYWIEKMGWNNLDVAEAPMVSAEYCYAALPENRTLLAQFAEGLATLEKTGEYRKIRENWLGIYSEREVTFWDVSRYVLMALAPVLLVLAAALLWSRSLKMQVAVRTEELRRERDLSDRIIHDGPLAIVIMGADGAILSANPQAEKILGLEKDEAEGRAYNDPDWRIVNFDGNDISDEDLPFRKIMGSRRAIHNFQHALRSSDGSLRYLSISGAPLTDAQGNVERVVFALEDITEREKTAAALREKDERLRHMGLLLDMAPASITVHTKTGRFLYANQVTFSLHGYSREEFMALPLAQLDSDQSAALIQERIEMLERDGEASFEVMHKRKDGTLFPLKVFSRIVDWDDEAVILSVAADITERKRAEEALRASEELHRITLASIGDGVVSTDAEGRVVTLNPLAEELTGWHGEDAAGRPLSEVFRIVNAYTRAEIENPAAKVLASGKIVGLANHTVLIARDGTERQIADSAAPIRNANGEILGVVLVFRDVTDEYAAAERLRKSEELFQTMLALIPDMISIHDPDMNIVYSNWNGFAAVPEERRTLGEKCYKVYRGLDSLCPDCRAIQVLETKKPYAEELELPEGRWVELHVIPILGSNGECELFVEWVRDVTERRETDERLRQMQKMDAIGQLAGGVAHDFNNQLAGVMGYADMLQSRLDDDDLRRYADNILVAARRAGDLTQKLLAFARKGQYESVPVDIHDILHEVADFLHHSIDKRIEIKQILSARPSTTKGDPGQLQNAILNLAINASDAMPEGGELILETGIAELDAEYCASLPYSIDPGPYLRICVTDTGAGIPREDLERIFEPFFTTKEVGKGTGMGLAAVYGTVKQHGGAINVYSEVGHGTTFRVYLPLEQEAARQVQHRTDPVHASHPAVVLIVDDEEIIRNLAVDMLTAIGYLVKTAEDGESAVAFYEKHWQEIDLVILDMVMPKMNGPEAYRAMKEVNPDVKVLLASGYSINGAAQGLLAEGVHGFIQKPFERAALSAKVAEALQDASE